MAITLKSWLAREYAKICSNDHRLVVEDDLTNKKGGVIVNKGELTAGDITNERGGRIINDGVVTADDVTNNGRIVNNGIITDALTNAGTVINNGIYNADVDNFRLHS